LAQSSATAGDLRPPPVGPKEVKHGSPSKQDSEIPLIVANSTHAEIGAHVSKLLGDRPFQQKVTDVLLGRRARALGK
jgi:hypothetical protein